MHDVPAAVYVDGICLSVARSGLIADILQLWAATQSSGNYFAFKPADNLDADVPGMSSILAEDTVTWRFGLNWKQFFESRGVAMRG